MLLRLGGAVLACVSTCLSCAVSWRVLRVMWLACRCRSVVFGGYVGSACALMSGGSVQRGGLGGLAGPVWRALCPWRAPGGGPEERNTDQC